MIGIIIPLNNKDQIVPTFALIATFKKYCYTFEVELQYCKECCNPMFINRIIKEELLTLFKQYPIVTVLGPRQAGKTTLVRESFPDKPYVNLEHPETRAFAQEDPKQFLAKYPDGAIFDEIQRQPELLSYLQVIVDEKKSNGLYILTGSHQHALHQAITQSLAGRTALLKLYPFSIDELKGHYETDNADELLLKGFFPRIYDQAQTPSKAHANYIQTYLERDVREIIHLKDMMSFQKFLKLCAGRIGQVLNMHSLANEIGVSSHTIKHWISVLQASFILILLPPYFENIGKRLIKSPKLYFTDVGLASNLLGIHTPEQMERDPLRGQLFENMVIMDLYKFMLNQGKIPEFYFYRDNSQNEVDLICKQGRVFHNIEIKSSQTYRESMTKTLHFLKPLLKGDCFNYLIYAGEGGRIVGDVQLLNYQDESEALK
jgi:predicted AAA+ superfamily ATPase